MKYKQGKIMLITPEDQVLRLLDIVWGSPLEQQEQMLFLSVMDWYL